MDTSFARDDEEVDEAILMFSQGDQTIIKEMKRQKLLLYDEDDEDPKVWFPCFLFLIGV